MIYLDPAGHHGDFIPCSEEAWHEVVKQNYHLIIISAGNKVIPRIQKQIKVSDFTLGTFL